METFGGGGCAGGAGEESVPVVIPNPGIWLIPSAEPGLFWEASVPKISGLFGFLSCERWTWVFLNFPWCLLGQYFFMFLGTLCFPGYPCLPSFPAYPYFLVYFCFLGILVFLDIFISTNVFVFLGALCSGCPCIPRYPCFPGYIYFHGYPSFPGYPCFPRYPYFPGIWLAALWEMWGVWRWRSRKMMGKIPGFALVFGMG